MACSPRFAQAFDPRNAIGLIQAAFREFLHLDFIGVQRQEPFPDLGEVVIVIGAK
jgi:hypothetical protein